MPRLSLAMIVKNEEERLGHSLASVQGLVDEMIVLDTGSTDRSVEIARSFGATVIPFVWVDDFSAARNAAIARCSGEWILVLDADESIDPLDHAPIREALGAPGVQAYYLWLREYFRSGAFIGISGPVARNASHYSEGAAFSHQQSYQAVRLFRRQAEPVFQGRIHELAEGYFLTRNLPMVRLDAVIHHFGKVDTERDRIKQLDYTRLAKLEAGERPGDPMAHYNVVQQALLVEDWAAVLSAAEAYLALEERVPMMIYLGAAQALLHLDRGAEALPFLDVMLAKQENHVVALDTKGEVLARLGRKDQAQACFLTAMETEPGFTLPFLHLSRMLEEQGDAPMARSVLEVGLDQNPKDLALWAALVASSASHEPQRAAADAWDALQAVPEGGQGIWHQLVIHALLAQDEKDDARLVLQRGLQAFPGHSELMALAGRMN